MRPAIEVTQSDRELFITLSNADGQMAERILCGQAFTWEVEQIARHRLAEREAAFADGFSAALQGAEAAIWEVEDDAFLYPTVSDALQEVIAELQEMESNWTKRSSVNHRHAVQAEAQLAEREAVAKWLLSDAARLDYEASGSEEHFSWWAADAIEAKFGGDNVVD